MTIHNQTKMWLLSLLVTNLQAGVPSESLSDSASADIARTVLNDLYLRIGKKSDSIIDPSTDATSINTLDASGNKFLTSEYLNLCLTNTINTYYDLAYKLILGLIISNPSFITDFLRPHWQDAREVCEAAQIRLKLARTRVSDTIMAGQRRLYENKKANMDNLQMIDTRFQSLCNEIDHAHDILIKATDDRLKANAHFANTINRALVERTDQHTDAYIRSKAHFDESVVNCNRARDDAEAIYARAPLELEKRYTQDQDHYRASLVELKSSLAQNNADYEAALDALVTAKAIYTDAAANYNTACSNSDSVLTLMFELGHSLIPFPLKVLVTSEAFAQIVMKILFQFLDL